MRPRCGAREPGQDADQRRSGRVGLDDEQEAHPDGHGEVASVQQSSPRDVGARDRRRVQERGAQRIPRGRRASSWSASHLLTAYRSGRSLTGLDGPIGDIISAPTYKSAFDKEALGDALSRETPGEHDLRRLRTLYRALGDETRLRMIGLLAEVGPMPVNELSPRVGLSQPLISWHLRILRLAGIVDTAAPGPDRRSAGCGPPPSRSSTTPRPA